MLQKKHLLQKYYNSRAACQVLACLMEKPSLILSKEFPLQREDFLNPLHEVLYGVILDLSQKQIQTIRPSEVEAHLHTVSPITYDRFEQNRGFEWLEQLCQIAELGNYEYHYFIVKKLACLRSFIAKGVEVTELLDYTQIDPHLLQEQEERFFRMSLGDILAFFDRKLLQAKQSFVLETGDEGKVGENAEEYREQLKQSPAFGYAFESDYLTAIGRGLRRGALYVESRNSGNGKSRIGLKRLVLLTAPRYWDPVTKQFIDNPQGQGQSGLYINTELERIEIETIVWATISGIPEHKIIENQMSPEEETRLEEAIKIAKEARLFTVTEENYNIAYLDYVVSKYVLEEQIAMVVLDYIELTAGLTSEFIQATRGMQARPDMILLNLSAALKNIARRYQVALIAFTQVSENARRDETIRDAGAIKDSKSIQNKADLGLVTFELTAKQREMITPIVSKKGLNYSPNICYYVYKNRGGRYKNVQVYVYQDLSTMQVYDCFVTNDQGEILNIDPVKILA